MKKSLFFILFLFFSLSVFSQYSSKDLPFKEDGIYQGIPYINGMPQPYYYDPKIEKNSPDFKEGLVYIDPDNSIDIKRINSSSYFYSSLDGKLLQAPNNNSFQVVKKPFKGIGIRKIEEVDSKGDIVKATIFSYYPFPVAPIEGNHRE